MVQSEIELVLKENKISNFKYPISKTKEPIYNLNFYSYLKKLEYYFDHSIFFHLLNKYVFVKYFLCCIII